MANLVGASRLHLPITIRRRHGCLANFRKARFIFRVDPTTFRPKLENNTHMPETLPWVRTTFPSIQPTSPASGRFSPPISSLAAPSGQSSPPSGALSLSIPRPAAPIRRLADPIRRPSPSPGRCSASIRRPSARVRRRSAPLRRRAAVIRRLAVSSLRNSDPIPPRALPFGVAILCRNRPFGERVRFCELVPAASIPSAFDVERWALSVGRLLASSIERTRSVESWALGVCSHSFNPAI
jgi:hypothetical protein